MGSELCKVAEDTVQTHDFPIIYPSILVKTSTWEKDSYCLYDYTHHSPTRKTFKTLGSCTFWRNPSDILIKHSGRFAEQSPDSEKLLHLKYVNDAYTLTDFTDPISKASKAFLVLRGLKGTQPDLYKFGYKLSRGIAIKFGRVKFLVRELFHPALGSDKVEYKFERGNEETKDEPNECRICRLSESTEENPLISPCNCSGSIKYIHVNCMKAWYGSKMACHVGLHTISYTIKGLECELCKYQFSINLMHGGKQFDLVNIDRPKNEPYVMLESLDTGNVKQIYIATLNPNTSITIGRMHACDIKINDISVSRHHATLKLVGEEVYLDDNNSKFGTLIEITEPLLLIPDTPCCVQIGRTVMTFLVKMPKFLGEEKFRTGMNYAEENDSHKNIQLEHSRFKRSVEGTLVKSKTLERPLHKLIV